MKCECDHCSASIRYKQLFILNRKNIYKLQCLNCGKTLKATNTSIAFYIFILLVPYVGLIGSELPYKYVLGPAWLMICITFIQPICFQYKSKKEE